VAYKQIWETISEDIKEGVISGLYTPGQRLTESELATKYSVSKTPIREAIRYLESIGFVEIIPRTMTVVTRLSKNDLVNLWSVQGVLEGLAARNGIHNLSEGAYEKMKGYVELLERLGQQSLTKNTMEYERVNFQFHSTVWGLSGNERLIELAINNHQHMQRFRSVFRRYPNRFQGMVDDHRQILEAIYEKDGERAEKTVREHIEKHAAIIAEALEKESNL